MNPHSKMQPDPWDSHVAHLEAHGIPEPGSWRKSGKRPATIADEQALYKVQPSFVDLLPWVEYLPQSETMLLDDGESVAAFFEITPVGTEGRDAQTLTKARDALENALQDSFDELDNDPWVMQLYAQDETGWDDYLQSLRAYIQPRSRKTAFTESYLRLFEHHLQEISKPGGLFKDTKVTQLPWRGQTRKIRLVVYRRVGRGQAPRGLSHEQALNSICERLLGGLANAGIKARRLPAAEIHAWLLQWFNPNPTLLGTAADDRRRFYRLAAYPPANGSDQLELASGTDFAQRLFFSSPRSDKDNGVWYFDDRAHRVVVVDRLRSPPSVGHITGETRNGGNAINAVFDQVPEGTVMCITLVVTPQDSLEGHLNYLSKKSIGETIDSENTRRDVQEARSIIGHAHKLYRGSVAFYLQGSDLADLDSRSRQLANVLLNAGLQPIRDQDEVAPLNSYLRWLPCHFNPSMDRKNWYTQLMFVQHIANLAPVWGRSQGTGHPGITLFNRGGGAITVDPLNRLDRQNNAHLFLFGPTGSGKSATLNNILNQVTAIYRPRLFVVEAGNSFGLFADFATRQGLSVHRVKLAPGAGVTLAPFSDAWRLVATPSKVQTLDVDAIDEPAAEAQQSNHEDQQRDILGELEITARLMITGGEDKEEARMTRADRSLLRQCIIDAARVCAQEERTTLTQDVRDALRQRSAGPLLPEQRRARLLEMADAIDMFCTGVNSELFNRPGSSWPEADVTIVDLATFAREGYSAEMALAYISLINTINNIGERDQFLGRPTVIATDEGHIVLKNRLTMPYLVKIIKLWRKLGLWFWLATQSIDDFPPEAEAMLSMIEWVFALSMPKDEVKKLSRFLKLNEAQQELIMSAQKEAGKFSEGVILSKSTEVLFRAVPPSLHLALSMTEPEEKNERYVFMQEQHCSELDAAIKVAERLDSLRGIKPLHFDASLASA